MSEITVNIVRANIKRGSQYESIVDVSEDGRELIGGAMLSFDSEKTDDEIISAAIDRIYIPMITQPQEDLE